MAPAAAAVLATTVVLAVAASPRIPGTRLHFGMPLAAADSLSGFARSRAPAGTARLEGALRAFGLASRATLTFRGDLLVGATFAFEHTTAAERRYVEDELTREDYRRACMRREPTLVDCTWSGATRIHYLAAAERLTVEVGPPSAPPPPEPPMPPTAAAVGPPSLTDTLVLDARAHGLAPPRILSQPAPVYPAEAREIGLQGVVRVLARVDSTGTVIETRLRRGIPELDEAALEVARDTRFAPYLHDGRPVGYWVEIPVRFLLH